jgi:uncharacterized protein YidB (DUF937 family)
MGLLDGLLGQVLGGMAQGGQRGGGLDDVLGKLGGQRDAPGGGGLGDLLNQMGGMPGIPGAGMGRAGTPGSGSSGLGGATVGALVMLALQMLQRNGGLEGVLGRLREKGHAREADSWVGTGANEPIAPDVLSQVLGGDELGRAARDVGLSPDEAANGLASIFPEVVNEMTPQGRVEHGSDDLVSRALELLERNRRG